MNTIHEELRWVLSDYLFFVTDDEATFSLAE